MMTEASKRGVAYVIGLAVLAAGIQLHVDTGEVFDGVTGEPLEGVHVISRWNADWFAGVKSTPVCFKVDATRTTRLGKYTLLSNSLSLNPMMSDRNQLLIYYKTGYEARILNSETPREAVALVPDTRKGIDRLKHLVGKVRSADCWISGTEPSAALPFFKAAYKEASGLGNTHEEMRYVNVVLALIKGIEAGPE